MKRMPCTMYIPWYTERKLWWSVHHKKKPKVLSTITDVLTTSDAFFPIRTKPQTFYNT
jgi:hypothetical protein